jgi:16S rRNA (adenine1518-N6/adenine1519-N6)-dimethyltransferase
LSAQTRTEISRLLEEHGLRPVHQLGQNFLADANVTRKIVKTAGVGSGDKVVEVGAGTGTLTAALVATGAHVVAYEIDERLMPILDSVVSGSDVELRFADITDVDLADALEGDTWTMVANLPYNVGTNVVMEALRRALQIERFVVMVQREVAERLVASPGTSEYGIPSVVTQIHSDAELLFRVPAQVFFPAPKVESAVVVMDRKTAPDEAELAIELARAGFGQRRKMLRRSLSSVLDDAAAALKRASLDPTSRAEQLSPDDFLRLARVAP